MACLIPSKFLHWCSTLLVRIIWRNYLLHVYLFRVGSHSGQDTGDQWRKLFLGKMLGSSGLRDSYGY